VEMSSASGNNVAQLIEYLPCPSLYVTVASPRNLQYDIDI